LTRRSSNSSNNSNSFNQSLIPWFVVVCVLFLLKVLLHFSDSLQAVSAPTGFRHLKSAADILKEFDPDFASKQKRPAAVPIAQAQATLRKTAPAGSGLASPPQVISPREQQQQQQQHLSSALRGARATSPMTTTSSPLSPREQQLMHGLQGLLEEEEEEHVQDTPGASRQVGPWRHKHPEYEPVNETVFCTVVTPFEAEKEGDLACVEGEVLACNIGQGSSLSFFFVVFIYLIAGGKDFSEDFWYGSSTTGAIGYFPQVNCKWIRDVN